MKVPAFEISQNGRKFYLTFLSSKQLLGEEQVKCDVWKRDHTEGYQREHTEHRSNSFARFIKDAEGISPTAILLSAREKGISFKLEDASSHFGTLKIPESCVLWLVDGQHRFYGIRKAAERGLEDFFVPTVIITPSTWDNVDDPRYEEAAQFLTINRTQKGVRPDLAERFLGELLRKESPPKIKSLPSEVTKGISWRPKAQTVCDWLNTNCPVWGGKIRLPNEPRDGTIVSQKAITDSIEPILKNENFTVYEAAELGKMLSNFWTAISKLCPKAFETPQEYVIQKTTGVIVLHRLFATIAMRCPQNCLTPDNFKKVLSKMPSIKDDFWHSKGEAGLVGSGGKSQDIVAGKLKDEIENLSPERPKKIFAM